MMASQTSQTQDTMSPEQSFAGYQYTTRYSTPVREDDSSVYEPSTVYSQRSDVSFTGYTGGLGITSHPYGPLPDEIGYNKTHLPYTPEASPSAPCQTSDAITTRSGISIAKKSLITRSPAVKSGRVQKRSRAEKAKNASSILSKPLSEAAKDRPEIHVADIETFVNRSTETRLSETSRNKKAGQIKRPMNAFMLYRKAYQEVAKTQCSQNNHQHVSKVCGAAWVLEPVQIKEAFDQWARIERVNHQRAHPGYKFMPSKPRKTRRDGDGDAEYSDNDSDWNGRRGLSDAARKSRYRQDTRLNEASSSAFDAVGNSVGGSSIAPYHEAYASPSHGQPHALLYDQMVQNPYSMSMHQYNGLDINSEMTSRAASPGEFDYPIHGLDGFGHNYSASLSTFDDAGAPLFGTSPAYDTYGRLPAGVSLPQEDWVPHMESDHGLMPMMADYAETTAQDAYLRGNKGDWKVEIMDEPGHFEDCTTKSQLVFKAFKEGATEAIQFQRSMTWISKTVTVTGLILLAHACYSAQEHSVISSAAVHHGHPQPLATHSLPIDISFEALVATLVVVLGLVLGTPQLRPIKWHEWAGKIEREGEAGFTTGSGEVEKDYRGNPFSILETRPGFVDIQNDQKMPRASISSASGSSGPEHGHSRGYRARKGHGFTRRNTWNSSSWSGYSVRSSPNTRNPAPQYSDTSALLTSQEERDPRSSSEPVQHEVVMAMDIKDDFTIGCAYFSTTDGILQVSEDIPAASLDIAEQLLIHAQPNSLLVSARAPVSFWDHLEKLATPRGK
ncbi:hypothetical protein FLONG3_9793 [Fusarium longipes]|uniref:HMG box domain-containing protein n=1 Tax=Fusarium longipes TaxID=694270 RepID=A0A395RUN2_9HYPO|nr:hypothetical protein FLONG3_9793 [Fusarium longipes]